jgi:hypothetical protein
MKATPITGASSANVIPIVASAAKGPGAIQLA